MQSPKQFSFPFTHLQGIRGKGVQLLLSLCLGAATFSAAATASAHAVWTSPTPRNNRSDLKDPYGPCGNVMRTTMSTTYAAGQTINVSWSETVDHPGCFLVDLSTSGDQNWMLLKNVPHTTVGSIPRTYSAQVTLPAGVSCTDCTLRLRQIMLGSDATPCPPNPVAMGATYYTCADVTIPAPPAPDMAQTPTPDLSTETPPPAMDTGCRFATNQATLPGSAVGLLVAALAMLRLALGRRRSS